MTAHDTNQPATTTSRPDATPRCPVTRASRDTVTVIVWRITADTVADADTTMASGAGDSPLTPRLARHLVAIYSDPHGTVLDFDADTHVRHAAEATGRTYSTLTNAVALGAAVHLPAPAGLILLRWPRPGTTGARQDATGLLSRCQQHLADDGSTIVIVTATQGGADGTTSGEYERVLLPAAEAAGLRHLHDIVAADAEDGRDAFTYATDQVTAAPVDAGGMRHGTATTLVIFGQLRRQP
jgi:hypothetical protein